MTVTDTIARERQTLKSEAVTVEKAKSGLGFELHADMGSWFYPGEGRPDLQDGETLTAYSQAGRIRGLLRGEDVLWWKTEDDVTLEAARYMAQRELEAIEEFEQKRDEMDAAYEALPPLFKLRIDKFREAGLWWRWKFEGYEMAATGDAAKLAAWVADRGLFDRYDMTDDEQAKESYKVLDVNEEIRVDLGLSDGHSGNTWGFMKLLAWTLLVQPERVVLEHGAMTPLTGCREYGCPHPPARDIRLRMYALVPGTAEMEEKFVQVERARASVEKSVEAFRKLQYKRFELPEDED